MKKSLAFTASIMIASAAMFFIGLGTQIQSVQAAEKGYRMKIQSLFPRGDISLEALERKAIPDTMDILGIYEVSVDSECNLLCFERKRLRKRGETEE